MRTAQITRKTKETDINLTLALDGAGKSAVDTGCGFLNHMLTLFAAHGRFDLEVKCVGDVDVDFHHTTEDIGIALGQAFAAALGEKRGINRYGECLLPMDESLVQTAVDLSGRCYLNCRLDIAAAKVGDFDTELAEEFFWGFARAAACTLHIRKLEGINAHHIIEAAFKSTARALRTAVAADPALAGEIPSTKGAL